MALSKKAQRYIDLNLIDCRIFRELMEEDPEFRAQVKAREHMSTQIANVEPLSKWVN